jgi:hypothetical protein
LCRQSKAFIVLEVCSFRAVDFDTGHYLVVAKVKERLPVNKWSHRFHMERFNLKKLNEVEDKKQFHVEVSHRFAALEDLDAVDTVQQRMLKIIRSKERS